MQNYNHKVSPSFLNSLKKVLFETPLSASDTPVSQVKPNENLISDLKTKLYQKPQTPLSASDAPASQVKPNTNLIGDLQNKAYPKPEAQKAAVDALTFIPGVGNLAKAATQQSTQPQNYNVSQTVAKNDQGQTQTAAVDGAPTTFAGSRPDQEMIDRVAARRRELAQKTREQLSGIENRTGSIQDRTAGKAEGVGTITPGSRPDQEMINTVQARGRELERRTREQTTNVAQAAQGGMSQETIDRLRTPQGPRALGQSTQRPGSGTSIQATRAGEGSMSQETIDRLRTPQGPRALGRLATEPTQPTRSSHSSSNKF